MSDLSLRLLSPHSSVMASTQNPKPIPNPAMKTPMEGEEEHRNWAEINRDVLVEIFRLVGVIGVFKNAGPVCRSWRKATKDEPELWRRIDLTNHGFGQKDYEFLIALAKLAIDRSGGEVEEFWIQDFGDDDLLQYLCDKTTVLKSLRLISCKQVHDMAILETVKNQPLLEEIEISLQSSCPNLPEVIGNLLPNLKKFRMNGIYASSVFFENDETEAFGIANSMHELRHLQLIGNRVTNDGLKAILEGCPNLETLDIRQCKNVCMDDSDLRARCARLRTLRLPFDSLDGYWRPVDTRGLFRSLNVDDLPNPDFINNLHYGMKNYFFFSDDDDEEEEEEEEEEEFLDNLLRMNNYFYLSDDDDDDDDDDA
ncbi:hypothetical protein LUZ60_005008 [Juncus effusus]|nr:hypothetical protein LUZ60_005008 [Juncus effusus]